MPAILSQQKTRKNQVGGIVCGSFPYLGDLTDNPYPAWPGQQFLIEAVVMVLGWCTGW
jgi:hypothetical protein